VRETVATELGNILHVIKQSCKNDKSWIKIQATCLALTQDDIENVRMRARFIDVDRSFLDFALQQLNLDEERYNYVQEGENMMKLYLRALQSVATNNVKLICDYPIENIMEQLGHINVSENTSSAIGQHLNDLFTSMDQSLPSCIGTSLLSVLTNVCQIHIY
jgi:hypothetical protein